MTNYGEYLARRPPTHEVEIRENTSWSCVHGVERWRSDCGCRTGGQPDWSQAWRAPLRAALDSLRDRLGPIYEQEAGRLLRDPWAARDAYIDVVLDRSRERVESFLQAQALARLDAGGRTRALRLLEMQRHLMLMYTSCGWFFNELSGIETLQVLQYAARALSFAERVTGQPLEEDFLRRLQEAKSNRPEYADGRAVFEQCVRPSSGSLDAVAAHYAVSSLFETYPEEARLFCYDAKRQDLAAFDAGGSRLRMGRVSIVSRLTLAGLDASFAVLLTGNHDIHGGVRPSEGDGTYQDSARDLSAAFQRGDLAAVTRLIDAHFAPATFSLANLFRDEQHKVLDQILRDTRMAVRETYRAFFREHAPLMHFVSALRTPLPQDLRAIAQVVINADLREQLALEDPQPEQVRALLADAQAFGIELDREGLAFTLKRTVERLAAGLRDRPADAQTLDRLTRTLKLAREVPFEVDLRWTQNVYWELRGRMAARVGDSPGGSEDGLRRLGEDLGFRVG